MSGEEEITREGKGERVCGSWLKITLKIQFRKFPRAIPRENV